MHAPVTRVLVAALAVWCFAFDVAGAQLSGPMRKPELVRLLADPAWTVAEVTQLVRQRCLGFTPSARDRADLVKLGADAPLLGAVDECARRARAAAGRERPK